MLPMIFISLGILFIAACFGVKFFFETGRIKRVTDDFTECQWPECRCSSPLGCPYPYNDKR